MNWCGITAHLKQKLQSYNKRKKRKKFKNSKKKKTQNRKNRTPFIDIGSEKTKTNNNNIKNTVCLRLEIIFVHEHRTTTNSIEWSIFGGRLGFDNVVESTNH